MAGAALAAKLWSRPRDVDWAEHRAIMRHPEHSRFAEIDGVRVHYQEAGDIDAPPLFLIHGFCASTFVWGDVLLALAAAGYRVIAPDLVGYGFSEKPKRGAYTIEYQAQHIIGLMDHLNIKRAAVVGSSYGGAVAMACALDHAERVERLIIVSGVSNDDIKREWLMRLGASFILGDFVSPLLLGSKNLHRWRMKDVYVNRREELFSEARFAAHRLPLRAAATHKAVLTTLRHWSAERLEREAHSITQPALLIWGEDDREVPLRDGLRLLREMPAARLFVYDHCGHLPQEEYPQMFTRMVADFCRNDEERAVIQKQNAAEELSSSEIVMQA